jgi:hypothetical protein
VARSGGVQWVDWDQCGCVISVAMYSSVSPEAIARGQGGE